MSKDIILLGAIGLGVYVVLSKQAHAANAQAAAQQPRLNPGKIPTSGIQTSVNGDMWQKLMGSSFTALLSGLRTSDGKPVSGGSGSNSNYFYSQLQAGDVEDVGDLPGMGGYDLSGAMDTMLEWA